MRPTISKKGGVDSSLTQKEDEKNKGGGEDDENKDEGDDLKKLETTIPMGPSFLEKDMMYWQNKFQKHNKEREMFKKYMGRTMEMTCLTRNTNIKAEEDDGGKSKTKKGSQPAEATDSKPSLFNQVLKRRRSRQSNLAPCVLDFDYAGDSAKYQHLIAKRSDTQAYPNKSMLNFEMNLRSYKNVTEFNAHKPFSFPSVKQFSPRKQWASNKRDNQLLNAEFKKKFNDKFAEANANELLHQFDKRGINASAQWQCSLRDLKRLPKDHATKSNSPKKEKKK